MPSVSNPSIHIHIYPPFYPSTIPSNHPFPPIYSSIYPTFLIQPSFYPSLYLDHFTNPFPIHFPIYPISHQPSIHPSIYLPIYPICFPICPFSNLSGLPFICPSIPLTISPHPCIHHCCWTAHYPSILHFHLIIQSTNTERDNPVPNPQVYIAGVNQTCLCLQELPVQLRK